MDDINYLVLASLANPDRKLAAQISGNLDRATQNKGRRIWFDSAYIGYIAPYPRSARQLWDETVAGIDDQTLLRDLLIVEIGRDWDARPETAAANWLKPHLGHSLAPMK